MTGIQNSTGLAFPEGPVALPDGSLLAVEIRGQCLTRIAADGSRRIVASLPGGPNGAAVGPMARFTFATMAVSSLVTSTPMESTFP